MLRFPVLQPVFRRLLSGGLPEFSLASFGLHRPLFGTGKFEEKLPVASREEEKIPDSVRRKSC